MERARRILIVDDDQLVRKLVCEELSPLGAEVMQAENGLVALDLVERNRPDLITTDIEMPGCDGVSLCERLGRRVETLGIPILVLSSAKAQVSRQAALKAGAIEYFEKPFSRGSLRAHAESIFERLERNRARRIMSIDRSQGARDEIDRWLRRHGFAHRSFEAPAALIHAMATEGCDLLLLDFALPGHGTYDILDAIKRGPNPALVIIGLADGEDRRTMANPFHNGARDVILKPFTPAELLLRVEHQLNELSKESKLRELATVDPLTLQFNRGETERLTFVEVQRAIRDERDLGILMIDIDHFKMINDTYGHGFGDEVLKSVAANIKQAIRPTDVLGRFGGEEFLVLVPRASQTRCAVIAERIRGAIEGLMFQRAGHVVKVTASIGAKNWRYQDLDVNLAFAKLVEAADQALYAAKAGGRNRCVGI